MQINRLIQRIVNTHKKRQLWEKILFFVCWFIFIFAGLAFFNNVFAAELEFGKDGESLYRWTSILTEGARGMIDALLNEGSRIRQLIDILWRFFYFFILAWTLTKWGFGSTDFLDIFITSLLGTLMYTVVTVPAFGESSTFVAFAKGIALGTRELGLAVFEDIFGRRFDFAHDWFIQMGSRIYLDISVLDIGSWIMGGIMQWCIALQAAISVAIDLVVHVGLLITLISGIFFVPLAFFDAGIGYTASWLRMVIGFVLVNFFSKIIQALTIITWLEYLQLRRADAFPSFWQDNVIVVAIDNINDVFVVILLTLVFIVALIMSWSWASSLAQSAVPNAAPGKAVGAIALARRLL